MWLYECCLLLSAFGSLPEGLSFWPLKVVLIRRYDWPLSLPSLGVWGCGKLEVEPIPTFSNILSCASEPGKLATIIFHTIFYLPVFLHLRFWMWFKSCPSDDPAWDTEGGLGRGKPMFSGASFSSGITADVLGFPPGAGSSLYGFLIMVASWSQMRQQSVGWSGAQSHSWNLQLVSVSLASLVIL